MTSIQSTAPSADAASGVGRKLTLLSVATLTIMSGTAVSPSLPAIEAAFADVENVALLSRMVLTLPALFVALWAPLIGSFADRYGRLRLLMGSIMLYGLSGVSGLFTDNLTVLLAGRAALGIAVGGIMTLATALVGDYFSGQERERYLGLQQAFTGLGGVVFVIGGGVLADLHWRAPFAVYAIAFALVPAIALFLTEPRRFAASSPTAPAVVAPVKWLPVVALCLLTFLINVAFYVVPSQLPFHMRALEITAPSSAGLALGLHNLVMAGTAFGYGRLRASLGVPAIFAIGLGLMGFGFALASAATIMPAVLIAMAVSGAGLGIVVPNLMSAAISVATPASRGRIAGLVTASMFIGHFSSPFASQPCVEAFGYPTTFLGTGIGLGTLALACAAVGFVSRKKG